MASMACSRVYPCVALGGAGSRSHAPRQRLFPHEVSTAWSSECCSATRSSPRIRNAVNITQEALGITESGEFSISDDELSSQGYNLHRSLENINLDDLNNLFVKVGFPRRQNQKLLRALEHTGTMLWFSKAGKVIAFARATGDEVFNAIIWDVVVDPDFQRLGIGKAVMERLLADLMKKGINNISLFSEANVLGFYRSLGFVVDPEGIRAMSLSRKRRV